ncbi:sulfurtransferase [Aquimarina aquimarini]|uniref:sulfurtransferase n=1 Tax=Aquimarina aquimarini TaxID=1191734 RepID=UPI001F41D429|nr:sulfurtransferase [Aquimarina aquimarini]
MNTLQIKSPLVSINWLYKHLNDTDLVILDATIKKVTADTNTQKQYQKIKGARFFDLKKTFFDKNTAIPNMLPSPEDFTEACKTLGISSHHKIVVYDTLGIYSSPRVWWMFKTMGFDNIAVLDGGFPAWQKEKLPCEKLESDIHTYDLGNFEATYIPKLVTSAQGILAEINNTNTLILDARSSGRFKATEPEPRESLKGGHIPNSMNLHYIDVLNNGKMRSTNELEEILKNFNIEDKKLIFTCGSGITACIIMLATVLVGYKNVSIYDGSWSEWGQLNGAPIEC